MKKLHLFTIIALIILTSGFINKPSGSLNSPKPEYVSAVLVTQDEYDTLTAAFVREFPNSTQGGMLNKDSLRILIESMSIDSNLVNFVFGLDTSFNKTSLILRACINPGAPTTPIICLRNGNQPQAFCPAFCEISNSNANTTLQISLDAYISYYTQYRIDNPKMTYGGNIDKEALIEIINSIPSNNPNLFFRFCYDTKYKKWSVIFIGGPVNNEILYYRNGLSEESFCPSNCSN